MLMLNRQIIVVLGFFIANLGKKLTQEGHEVYLVGHWNKRLFFDDQGVQVFIYKSLVSRVFFIFRLVQWFVHKIGKTKWLIPILAYDKKRTAKRAHQIIREKKIDVIESNDYLGEAAYIDTEIPLIIRCHGSYKLLSSEFEFRENKAFTFFETKVIAKANRIIGVSKFSALAVKKVFELQKTPHVIYNGIDTSHFKPTKSSCTIKYSIFYHGTISKPKGLDVLAKIFNRIIELCPRAGLHLIGKNDSGYLAILKSSLSKQAKNNLVYHGEVNQTFLPNLLEKAHVFVFPSTIENFSLAWLEAMALKKPIITSNIPISSEIIQNQKNGFIAHSVEDFIKIVLRLFNDDELTKTVGLLAYESVCNYYCHSGMVKKTIKCYQELISSHK